MPNQWFVNQFKVLARLLTATVFIVASAQAQASSPCKIMVMGDSLSAAYGLPVEQGWVALMESKLAEKFPKCSVVNASVSGETTAGGKSRLARLLEEHRPSLMILELGANDGLRGLPIFVMEKNLNQMIEMAADYKAETILVGMQIPPNYGPAYSSKFREAFIDVADEQEVELVPFMLEGFAQDPGAFQTDGIHPNAGAQPFILNNIWPFVQKALK